MKLLVSGITSFLGSKFKELYSDKYEIIGFSLNDDQNSIDMTDYAQLEELYSKTNPDVVIHFAAIVDVNGSKIIEVNKKGTENLVKLAKISNTPFIFMSSESVYGGRENGGYTEIDEYNPRSDYAMAKVESEKLIISSGLSYLILRGHRFVGFVDGYSKPKQFPDVVKRLKDGNEVSVDSKKLFRPSYINHICEVIDYHIQNKLDSEEILNVVVDKGMTYYQLLYDVILRLNLDSNLLKLNGEETAWPQNSCLSVEKLKNSEYPYYSYEMFLEDLANNLE